jgi:class 3 adenylate cyclase
LTDRLRHVTPIIMEGSCVACHNTHPDNPKRDWKVGDVRGIQEVTVTEPIAINVFSFKYLLAYLVCAAASGFAFIAMQRRQTAVIAGMNRKLETANQFLASVSSKISSYLPPQVYQSIFTGQTEIAIHTKRKKLTIFFSDIKDFTAATERMQPEDIASLLNEYLTEMSKIALHHGGTLDKFIGDAIVIFFGDPETKGTAADAKACIQMAADMQRALAGLNAKWRNLGIEHPFQVRMGVNTGFCNVGNFGSADRMEYTIIGAEANLAARLQSIAEPGQIVMSYETYALVRDTVTAHALPPISMKGISRQVLPYAVETASDMHGRQTLTFSRHARGLDLFLDPSLLDPGSIVEIRELLHSAAASLEGRKPDSQEREPSA